MWHNRVQSKCDFIPWSKEKCDFIRCWARSRLLDIWLHFVTHNDIALWMPSSRYVSSISLCRPCRLQCVYMNEPQYRHAYIYSQLTECMGQNPPWCHRCVKHFAAFYGTRKFIIMLATAWHWSLQWFTYTQPTVSQVISFNLKIVDSLCLTN